MKLFSLPGALTDFGERSVRRFVEVEALSRPPCWLPRRSPPGAVTWVSVIILVLSATSFTRALQRMFQRAYQAEPGSWKEAGRGLAGLAAFALWIVVSSPLRNALAQVGGLVFAIMVSTLLGFVVWLATPAILLGAMNWRRLLPGALVSAMLGALLGAASGIYLPILLTWSSERYGLIGVAFSFQSWLLAVAFVVVIGAVVGAVASERLGQRLDRIARASPTGIA